MQNISQNNLDINLKKASSLVKCYPDLLVKVYQ